MGLENPAATSLESPASEAEVNWKKSADKTGFVYSGKNTFKSGEGEFTTVGQGDSFAGSHAYLLLADVPGAEANSGASITAEDSNGKAAFIATETRGTTEQEVAVGAGSEVKTVVTNGGLSDFLQLASAAKRKINFGSAVVEWGGGHPNSKETTVTHSLSTTPVCVIATAESVTIVGAKSKGATTFKVWARTGDGSSPGAGTKETLHWLAIG